MDIDDIDANTSFHEEASSRVPLSNRAPWRSNTKGTSGKTADCEILLPFD